VRRGERRWDEHLYTVLHGLHNERDSVYSYLSCCLPDDVGPWSKDHGLFS